MHFEQVNYKLKINIIVSFFGILILNSCNTKSNDSTKKETKIIIADTLTPKSNLAKPNIIIDSIRMHAFDNLYFGIQQESISKKYLLDDMNFVVKTTKSDPEKGLYYFILVSESKISTKQKAKKVLDELVNIISKKYKNGKKLNKTFKIKHPEEIEEDETFFDTRAMYKYDKKLIGLPYEYVKCYWDLKYKQIQIGYLIDHKNRSVMYQTSPEDDNYIIYIEMTSKMIQPKIDNSKDTNNEKDTNKF